MRPKRVAGPAALVAGAAIALWRCGGTSEPCALPPSGPPELQPDATTCSSKKPVCLVEGCSCLVYTCIPDQSLEKSDICVKDRQCVTGLVCAAALFQCFKPCTAFFTTPGECDAGEYCRPVINDNVSACTSNGDCSAGTCELHRSAEMRCRATEGVCVAPELCTVDADGGTGVGCRSGEVCVKLSGSASECLLGCEVTWSGATYNDNCASSPNDATYCSPVGTTGSRRLVCLDSSSAAGAVGDACDGFDKPCAKGAACLQPISSTPRQCYSHCDHNDAVGGGIFCDSLDATRPICCTQLNRGSSSEPVGDDFGFCASTCP